MTRRVARLLLVFRLVRWGWSQSGIVLCRSAIAIVAGSVLAVTLPALFARADDYLDTARQHLEAGRTAEALIEAKNAVQAHPGDAQARILLGVVYLAASDAISAEDAFERARDLSATGDELALLLARARLASGSYDRLLNEPLNFDEAGQLTDVRRDLLVARGDALLGLEKFDEADAAYDRALKAGDNAMALRGKAMLASARNQPERSRQLLDRALRAAPASVEIVAADAEWHLRQGAFELARARFEEAISLDPAKLIPHIGLIRAQLGMGDVDAALATITALRAVQPSSVLVALQDGVVQLAAGDYTAAKNAADQVLAVDRYNAVAMNIAGTSAYALGEDEQAVLRLTNYLQAAPQDDQARLTLTVSLLRTKDISNARAALRPLLAREPQDVRAVTLAGAAEAMDGNAPAASQYWQKASVLSPESEALYSGFGMI